LKEGKKEEGRRRGCAPSRTEGKKEGVNRFLPLAKVKKKGEERMERGRSRLSSRRGLWKRGGGAYTST